MVGLGRGDESGQTNALVTHVISVACSENYFLIIHCILQTLMLRGATLFQAVI